MPYFTPSLPLSLWYLRVTERVKKSRNKSGCYFYEAMRSRSCGLELRVRESSSHFSICISSPYVVLNHRGAVVTELITVRKVQSITCIPDTGMALTRGARDRRHCWLIGSCTTRHRVRQGRKRATDDTRINDDDFTTRRDAIRIFHPRVCAAATYANIKCHVIIVQINYESTCNPNRPLINTCQTVGTHAETAQPGN